jgi:hypothetical protein
MAQKYVKSGRYRDPIDTFRINSALLYQLKKLAQLECSTYRYQLMRSLFEYLPGLPKPKYQKIKRRNQIPEKSTTPRSHWSPRIPAEYIEAVRRFAIAHDVPKFQVYSDAIASYLKKKFPNWEKVPDAIAVHRV